MVKLNFSINIGFPKKGILKMVFQVPFGNQTWRAGKSTNEFDDFRKKNSIQLISQPHLNDTDTGGLLIILITNY